MLRSAHTDGDSRARHLAALRKRHADIEDKIEDARVHHKSISDFYLSELKKQKLHVKEMIEQLASHAAQTGGGSGDVMRA